MLIAFSAVGSMISVTYTCVRGQSRSAIPGEMLNMQSNKQFLGATSSLGHLSGALLHQYGLRNLKVASSYSV